MVTNKGFKSRNAAYALYRHRLNFIAGKKFVYMPKGIICIKTGEFRYAKRHIL